MVSCYVSPKLIYCKQPMPFYTLKESHSATGCVLSATDRFMKRAP